MSILNEKNEKGITAEYVALKTQNWVAAKFLRDHLGATFSDEKKLPPKESEKFLRSALKRNKKVKPGDDLFNYSAWCGAYTSLPDSMKNRIIQIAKEEGFEYDTHDKLKRFARAYKQKQEISKSTVDLVVGASPATSSRGSPSSSRGSRAKLNELPTITHHTKAYRRYHSAGDLLTVSRI